MNGPGQTSKNTGRFTEVQSSGFQTSSGDEIPINHVASGGAPKNVNL